jgi:flagellin
MSMVVQHNMQAANANRMLGITSGAQAKSTEKLSSGYKINRAADDAAGLTISEKMRKQIRGLDKASSNAQDGVSSVQTAEGALTEVHSMLQRMNELATQAANGTNSQDDRSAIQDEVDQLTTEIDRVAETTKFNEIYLLKGDSEGATKTSYLNAHDAGLDGTKISQNDTTATVTLKELNVGDKQSIAGKEYTIGDSVTNIKALVKDKNTIKIGDQTFKISGTDVTDENGNKLYIKTADGANAANTTFAANNLTSTSKFKNDAGADTANTAVTIANIQSLITDDSRVTVNGKEMYAMAAADATAGVSSVDSSVITATQAYKKEAAEIVKASNIGATTSSVATTDGTTAYAGASNSFVLKLGTTTVNDSLAFNLHVGADADMTNKINVNIDSMDSASLGIKGLNVTDKTGIAATYAIDAISDAVAKVSAQRSSLGAVQNRLEHTIDNLDNISENTSSAESRIRDTDMAKEMVNYSKNNILAQAGQSMLAQANQSNQGVLSLLQ